MNRLFTWFTGLFTADAPCITAVDAVLHYEEQLIDKYQLHRQHAKCVWAVANKVNNRAMANNFFNEAKEHIQMCRKIEDEFATLVYEVVATNIAPLIIFANARYKLLSASQTHVTQSMRLVSIKLSGYR